MLYLKRFNTHAEYEQYMDDNPVLPNVSICMDEPTIVHYNKYIPQVEALSFEAKQNNTIICLQKVGSPATVQLEYSTDDGGTWQTYAVESEIRIGAGERFHIRNVSTETTKFTTDSYSNYYNFYIDGDASVYGDISYLINRNGNVDSISYNCFAKLFIGCTGLTEARKLILPATTLLNNCYQYMFAECTSLTTAPTALPATALVYEGYYGMFSGCTSLTDAPELPATTLANYCYQSMFNGCTSLTDAPELPATTLAGSCYAYMFSGCTSLTTAPVLPATALAGGCYQSMFNGCTSLTTAPELPATTLANYCYQSMFNGCYSLTSITCFATSITASQCTYNWVYGVPTAGTFTKMAGTEWAIDDPDGIPYNWTVIEGGIIVVPNAGIANYDTTSATSVIYKGEDVGTLTASSTSDWITSCTIDGDSLNISLTENTSSSGRTGVVTVTDGNYSATYTLTQGYVEDGEGLTFVASEGESSVKLVKNGSPYEVVLEISTDGGHSWNQYTFGYEVSLSDVGDSVMFRNASASTGFSYSTVDCYSFSISGKCSVENDITYLINRNGNVDSISNYCFAKLFNGCTGLTDVSGLLLPATTLASNCYSDMFSACTSLTEAPELPATALAQSCYQSMFAGCTSLTEAPELPATALAQSCYQSMFSGCTSLTTAPELPATTLDRFCYDSMFRECTSLTTAPSILPATALATYCYENMFQGCTSLTEAPELPATTLTKGCYYNMFYGCYSLISITCLATSITASQCTYNWVGGVPTAGTFTKMAGTEWAIGDNGIPYNWTVVEHVEGIIVVPNAGIANYDTTSATSVIYKGEDVGTLTASSTSDWITSCTIDGDSLNISLTENTSSSGRTGVVTVTDGKYSATYTLTQGYVEDGEGLTFVASEGESSVKLVKDGSPNEVVLEISTDSGHSWCQYTFGYEVSLSDVGDSVMFRNTSTSTTRFSKDAYGNKYMFNIVGNVVVSDDVTYLLNKNGNVLTLPDRCCFGGLFSGCAGLTDASELIMPSTSLTRECYSQMFCRCESLTDSPILPAESLEEMCYESMFRECMSLSSVTCLATSTEAHGMPATMGWLQMTAMEGIFYRAAGVEWRRGGEGVPYQWEIRDY